MNRANNPVSDSSSTQRRPRLWLLVAIAGFVWTMSLIAVHWYSTTLFQQTDSEYRASRDPEQRKVLLARMEAVNANDAAYRTWHLRTTLLALLAVAVLARTRQGSKASSAT